MKASLWLASMAAALTLTACGGGGGSVGGTGGSAIFLKDAPITTANSRPADEVNVEILHITVESQDRQITVFDAAPGSGIVLNILALNFPMLLANTDIPVGSYDQIKLILNTANATIHFTDDNSTVPLLVNQEGDDEGELEFEFEPPFTVEAGGVSNAVVDFAPVVTFDGANYILGHDHEMDDTGEVEDVDGEEGSDHHGAEVDGAYVSMSGDLLTVLVHGSQAQIDISTATSFEANGLAVDKAVFIASLSSGDEIEGEGVFTDGVLVASKIKNQGPDE